MLLHKMIQEVKTSDPYKAERGVQAAGRVGRGHSERHALRGRRRCGGLEFQEEAHLSRGQLPGSYSPPAGGVPQAPEALAPPLCNLHLAHMYYTDALTTVRGFRQPTVRAHIRVYRLDPYRSAPITAGISPDSATRGLGLSPRRRGLNPINIYLTLKSGVSLLFYIEKITFSGTCLSA